MPFRHPCNIAKIATITVLAVGIALVQACGNFRVRSEEVQDGIANITQQKAKSDCRRHLNHSDYSECIARANGLETERKMDKSAP